MARRRVTIDDIAREAQASPTTVSLVLRDKPGIGPETRQRVLAVARELGYQHRGPVRPSSASDPVNVALVVRTQQRYGEGGLPSVNPFYSWVLAGIESAARSGDVNLLYAGLPVDGDNHHVELPTHLLQQALHGVLLVGAFRPETVEAIMRTRSGPVVAVDGVAGVSGMDAVVTDNAGGAAAAVRHLVGLGHRRVAFLAPAEGVNPNFDQRRAGYRSVLAGAGLEPLEVRIPDDDVDASVADLLGRQPPPTAVLATNDRFALAAVAALGRRGLRVPEDVSVMGFDDIQPAAGLPASLTTMAVDKSSLGRLAVEAVRYRLAWPDAAEVVTSLRPRLVVRSSVGPPADGPPADGPPVDAGLGDRAVAEVLVADAAGGAVAAAPG